MDASEEFMRAFVAAADAAVTHRMRFAIVTKGGEVIEGVPTTTGVDLTNRPASFTPAQELDLYGPVEHTVTLEGKEILAQEVAQFTLTLR